MLNVGLLHPIQPVLTRILSQVVFKKLYPTEYTPAVSTRVSNALLVGQSIPFHVRQLTENKISTRRCYRAGIRWAYL